MQATFICFSHNLNYALGWMVVHSLWQATAIALLSGVLAIVLRDKTAKVRYLVSNIALAAVLASAVVTFCIYYDFSKEAGQLVFIPDAESAVNQSLATSARLQTSPTLTDNSPLSMEGLKQYFNRNIYLIVTIWALGVALFMLRLLGGISYVYYLKSRLNFPAEEYWQELLDGLKTRVGIQKGIDLLESALVRSPIVIGYLKPVILFPIGAINRLNPNEVEAILAHELAHVLRNDYLFNIIQSVIEALFYFHPAVWWISAQIRNERENCCDDVAIELCGNSMTYAKSLVSVQEMAYYSPQMAMAFAGKSNKNQLLMRVQRVLNQPQNKANVREKLIATSLLVALMMSLSFCSTRFSSSQNDLFTTDVVDNTNENKLESSDNIERTELTIGSNFLKFRNKNNQLDSMPLKSEVKDGIYNFSDNTQTVNLMVKGNSVVQFNINGLEVASADIPKFERMINRIISPDSPPSPPMPPSPLSPTSPLSPPVLAGTPEGLNIQSDGNQLTVNENGLHLKGTDEHGKPIVLSVDKNGFVMNGNGVSMNFSSNEDTYEEDAKPINGIKSYHENGKINSIVGANHAIQRFNDKGELEVIIKKGVVKTYKNKKLVTVTNNGHSDYSENNKGSDNNDCEECFEDLKEDLYPLIDEMGGLKNKGIKDENLTQLIRETKKLEQKLKVSGMDKDVIKAMAKELKSLQKQFNRFKKDCKSCDEGDGYSYSYGTDEQAKSDAEQAKSDAEQAKRNEIQAKRNAEQAQRNAKMNAERLKQNREQMNRDREQAKRDAEQAQRDREQAKRDATSGVAKDNLFRSLVNEGYLSLNKQCTVKFDSDALIVNGKAMDDAVFNRYKTAFERQLGYKADYSLSFKGVVTSVNTEGVSLTGQFHNSISRD